MRKQFFAVTAAILFSFAVLGGAVFIYNAHVDQERQRESDARRTAHSGAGARVEVERSETSKERGRRQPVVCLPLHRLLEAEPLSRADDEICAQDYD